ncbi:MAG: PGF-pre-PGF domain-containing protein [Candidatus Methanoperedens sp.]|nr:PGF-pre-PGF domain-containing protein [Candidatus Methanoperedens sp.]
MINSNINGGKALKIVVGFLMLSLYLAWVASAATLTVNASGGAEYMKIQDAINDGSAGDTILVYSGTYYENVNVTKQLFMRGIGSPLVNGGGGGSAITLESDGIVIEGFTATGVTSYPEAGIKIVSNNNTLRGNNASSNDHNGIYLDSVSNNNTVIGNNASNNWNGISLQYSSNNNTVIGNNASNNMRGIYLYYSSNNTISGNNASNNTNGISLEYSTSNTISGNNANSNINHGILLSDSSNNNMLSGNNVSNNGLYGIYLFGSNNTIIGNNASNNDYGIFLQYSSNNTITGNNANSNNYTGISVYYSSNNNTLIGNNGSNNWMGISLQYSSNNNTLSGNIANSNSWSGIDLYSSSKNILSTNIVRTNNGYGIYLAYSSNNKFYHNNLITNTNQAYSDNTNSWDSGYPSGGNYWSDYTGIDSNSDDIGDTPYNIGGGAGAQDRYPFMIENGWLKSEQKPLALINSSSFVENRTAIITWSTNNFADSLVKYGITPGNYPFNVHFNESVTFHNVTLTNLSPDTNYYFVINSTDAAFSMQSQELVFWTPYNNFQGNSNLTNIEIQQLTDYEELASSPVWIEDKIFYASNRTGNMDVWVMDKDGSNKTQITNSSSEEYPSDGWVLSENNSKIYKIIYVSRINGHSSIWIINGDGTNSTQLINDSYENLDPVLVSVPIPVIFGMQPSGTIDNNVPLINASYYSNYGNISKVNLSVDGFDVTSNASISASNLSYIPTEPIGMGGHNFTVKVETDKNTTGFGSQSFDIRYIYNTSPQSCIVLNDTPRISANISVGYGNISSFVMILDEINVTSNLTIYPSYIEYIPNVPLVNGSHSVYTEVNTEIKSIKGFSDNKTWTFVLNNSMIPIPSCYGGSGGGGGGGGGYQKIIFASNRSGNFDLWMMNLNGTGLEQMNYEPSNETSPAWIESKVVYVSDKSGNKDIWSMDVNGSNKKQLTNSVLDEDMPSSSYVGGIIYTESKDGVSNLYAMNTNGTGNIKITNSSSFKAIPAHSSMFSQSNEGILYGSEGKAQSGIYLMNFEEKGLKAKFWNLLENYSLQATFIDTKSNPAQAWLNLKRNGIPKVDNIVGVGDAFSIVDTGKVVLTAILNKISSSDNYFEVELLNVTQYSSIDRKRLFTNETKILVNKILLIIPTPTPIPTDNSGNRGNSGYNGYSGSGNSGSGGGGGGGSSGENYSNIEVVEKYDMQISKDVLTSYRFTHAKNPIMFVNITGNTSLGMITASMEVLKNISTFVNVSPEGLVYKNANIWVGTSGFATPKNIKEALIKFRIDNAWMSTNGVSESDIVLMKWEGKSWIKLETKVSSKDDINTYFEGKTNAFSPFAIVAKTAAAPKPTVTRTPIKTPKVTATETTTPEPTKKVPGFGIVLTLLGLMAVILRKRGW